MFIQKDETGRIVATYANLQPGIAEEWVEGALPEPLPKTREQVAQDRLNAYSNQLTGSDRLKIEADAERASGNAEKAKQAEAAWLARRAEIAVENPWPIEGKSK